jgi:hypothetical protein
VKVFRRILVAAFKIANHLGLIGLAARGFRYVASSGIGSDSCLKQGLLPVPVHFYSPIPDIGDLQRRDIWSKVSSLPGIDLREKQQLSLLHELGEKYGEECRWPLEADETVDEFFLKNTSFSFGCAASTYGMIRHFRPARVVEVGSGMSSRVIATALRANAGVSDKLSSYRVIDPFPSLRTKRLLGGNLIEQRVELLDMELFEQLGANDILFIDSSHSVKIGSDVNFLFLEVLPRLAPGVLVHVHDISLPYEYSSAYATNPAFRQFWTEQYLLQAFLVGNCQFDVLLAMNFLMMNHMDAFKKSFPYYDPEQHPYFSGSFWMRRSPVRVGHE